MTREGPESEAPLFGRHPVLELLRAESRRVDEIAILADGRGPALQELLSLARRRGVKIAFRTRDQLTAIAGTPHHQGVVARVAAVSYADVDDLLAEAAERAEPAFVLALDQVQDPRNLGADHSLGRGHGSPRGDPVQASLGGIDASRREVREPGRRSGSASPVSATWSSRWKRSRRLESGWSVPWFGAAFPRGRWTSRRRRAWSWDRRTPGSGRWWPRTCDFLVSLPMRGRLGAMNVSAVAAVMCYEVLRQREAAGSEAHKWPKGQKALDLSNPRT